MGWYEREVVPRIIEVACANKRMEPLRQQALEGVSGTVVELGFGSGPNLPAYPDAVERVVAIDPSATGRKLAAKKLAGSSIPVDFAGLDGQDLALDDASVDNAVSTFTLCTIPDAGRALAEVRRVLKPGGRLFFLEHGLAPDAKVAKRQHRWDPVQQRVAGGCHLDRDIFALVESAGFALDRRANFYLSGPKPWCYAYTGATAPK